MSVFLIMFFWLIGLFTGSLGIVQILIILSFGIPQTISLQKEDALIRHNPIIKGYFLTVLFWLIVVITAFLLIHKFLPGSPFISFCVGNGIPILLSFGKIGKNQSNVQDYISSNSKYFKSEEEE